MSDSESYKGIGTNPLNSGSIMQWSTGKVVSWRTKRFIAPGVA